MLQYQIKLVYILLDMNISSVYIFFSGWDAMDKSIQKTGWVRINSKRIACEIKEEDKNARRLGNGNCHQVVLRVTDSELYVDVYLSGMIVNAIQVGTYWM